MNVELWYEDLLQAKAELILGKITQMDRISLEWVLLVGKGSL